MTASDERSKFLITTSTFPYRNGDGQARFVLDLAVSLTEHGDVTVVAPHAPGARVSEKVHGVSVRRFRYFIPSSLERLSYGSGMRHNTERSWLARLQVPCLFVTQLLATSEAVLRGKPSVINAHWLVPQGLTSALVARILRVPLVLHVHAADVYFLQRFRVGPPIARFVVRSCSAVLADGSHVRDALNSLLGFESNAILRPMGVWVDRFRAGGEHVAQLNGLPERFVIFVGRLVEKKGVEFLIRALAIVRERVSDMELVIVGSGPLHEDLVAVADSLGLSDVVHFLGAREHDQVAGLLQLAEVACVPSIIDSRGETEGMPTVVLEAMAAGARVVGTNVNGIPDVLEDARNGWLVEPADPDALAAGLVSASTSVVADEIAEEGVRTAELNDWTQVASEYRRVLEEATRV